MRKVFKYNLQKVLDYRTSLEEQARLEVVRSRKKYQDQIVLVQNLEHELELALKESRKKENMTRDRIWLWNRYTQRMNSDLRLARLRLGELAREVSAKRQYLLEKSRDKRIIEKLKVKQKIKFEHEQEKTEQKNFDEMAVVRHKHKAI